MSGPQHMLGHNNGPSMEAGYTWRKHSWTKARAALLPNLPIEVLRSRVKRAKALGLPYKTYASVRASTGRDVLGFLFSNNALRVLRQNQPMPSARAAKLCETEAKLAALAHAPLDPEALTRLLALQDLHLDAVGRAPHFSKPWSEIASAVEMPLRLANLPRDGVLMVGDTRFEQDWSEAAKLAGFLSSDRYFANTTR
ncbi:MAG: hypothetical protein AAF340_08260 [Pseudomonadota bacterium]